MLAAKGTVPDGEAGERSGGESGKEWWDGMRCGEVSQVGYARFGETRDGEQDGSTETNAADCRGRREQEEAGGGKTGG